MQAGEQEVPSSEAMGWAAGACAERYDREVNRRFYRTVLTRLLERAPAIHGRGLDLGCGTGFSAEVLLKELPGTTWHGVDCSPAMLKIARGKPELGRVDFREASAEALPFADASFDVVVASFSWHWFGAGAGQEVRRVLRPGGWLLASVPVRRLSLARGNRALARALLAGRERFVPRPSQGLRFADVPAILPGPVRVARHELHVEGEEFVDGREMLEVMADRGALSAIFGADSPVSIAAPGPLTLEWSFAVLHVQV
jgi:SAM-dependent methyltransferase